MERAVRTLRAASGPLPALRSAAALAVLWVGVAAAQAPAPPVAGPQARDLRSWLLRIHEAATQRNFQGTFIVSSGGAMTSSRIAHYCDGPQQVERIDSLDGEKRVVLRHNDRVQTLWPEARVVHVEQRASIATFPALLQSGADRIGEHYELARVASDRIAGHEATVLVVQPRDAWRYGHRLWSEKSSGLLLRADVLGEGGVPLESSAFSEVSIGVRTQADAVLHAMKKHEAWRVLRPTMVDTNLDAEGWGLQPGVPGFRMVSCVKRSLEPGERAGVGETVQSIWSDGLTHVSVFIEPYEARRHAHEMRASVGATQTLMRRHGEGWWITVVGDVPPQTLKRFWAGLERKR